MQGRLLLKVERILLRDESGFYLQRALTGSLIAGGEIYFGRQTFADVKCQILLRMHFYIYAFMLKIAQYKLGEIHLLALYCTKCLPMYFTFEKSQIELGTKVDPL